MSSGGQAFSKVGIRGSHPLMYDLLLIGDVVDADVLVACLWRLQLWTRKMMEGRLAEQISTLLLITTMSIQLLRAVLIVPK